MPYKDLEQQRACCRRKQAAHPEYCQLNDARKRAKADSFPCTLTLADVRALRAPMRCSVTGLPLARNAGGNAGSLSPSLDRIVPALGYVMGNVRLVAHRFNELRGTADVSRDAEFRDRVLAELSP